MERIMENWETILTAVTVIIVVVVFLYRRRRGQGDLAHDDFSSILADALEYLKGWAGDRLAEVTEAEVSEVADQFYDRFVPGTAIEKFITREHMRATLWSLFIEWRSWFLTMRASVVGGAHDD